MIGSQLQKAIYGELTVAPPLAGGRVFDRPPADAAFPYVTIGDTQILDDGNSCADGWEAFSDIHIWSRPATGSKLEAKDIMADVVSRLTAESLTVQGFDLVIAQLQNSRVFRDPDGITEHAVVTMRHVLQPA